MAKNGACRPRRSPRAGAAGAIKRVGHVPIRGARTNFLSLRPARAGYCCSLAALLIVLGSESLQSASRRRRDPHDFVPSHPHQGGPHRHLQAQRALRRGGAQADQPPDARLARGRTDQDEPASDRSALGGSPRGRRHRADPGDLRLPLAGHQLQAAPALERGGQVQPAHARQRDRLHHPGRAAGGGAGGGLARPARRRRLLPVIGFRPHGYRRRAPLAAHAGGAACARDGERAAQQPPRLRRAAPAGRRGGAGHAANPRSSPSCSAAAKRSHAETAAATKPTAVAAPTSPPRKPADKPAEKLAAYRCRPREPTKTESFQLAAATTKPAARPETFQVASATSKTIAVVVTPRRRPRSRPRARPKPAASQAPAKLRGASQRLRDRSTGAGRRACRARQRHGERHHQRARLLAGTAERGAGRGAADRRARAPPPPRRAGRHRGRERRAEDDGEHRALAAGRKQRSRPAPSNALAYAAQPTPIAHARPAPPMGSETSRPVAAPPQTTVAVKRSDDRPAVAPPQQARRAGRAGRRSLQRSVDARHDHEPERARIHANDALRHAGLPRISGHICRSRSPRS